MELVTKIRQDERNEVELIKQLDFFDEVTEEDIRKTIWLLKRYPGMIDIIKNYEFAQADKENGMDAYDMLTAEGSTGKRVTGHELTSDVTANSVVLKEKRQFTYKFYLTMSKRINYVIANIRDPHEGLIAKLLFIDGMKYVKAQAYLETGYRKEIFGISATTFADKRRKVISSITNSFKINGTLEFIIIDYGRGRNKDGEIRFRLPNTE